MAIKRPTILSDMPKTTSRVSLEDDRVYDWSGQHIGWWQEQHIHNHDGDVAVFQRSAGSFGLIRPVLKTAPRRRVIEAIPTQPVRALPPTRAPRRLGWAQVRPF
jgi:hypothetical protein